MRQSLHRRSTPGPDLEQVERELTEWRRTHHAPTPIPERLWARAAALAEQLGVGSVARELALNYAQLKRRMATGVPAREESVAFVELLPPVMAASIGECSVEVESHRGSRMRIVMKDIPPSCLAGILRELAG